MSLKRTMLWSILIVGIILAGGSSQRGDAETFRVGFMEGGFPPMFFAEGAPQTGIFVDILNEICQLTGDDFEKKYASTARIKGWFADGDIDIEPGINPLWRSDQKHISRYTIPFMKYTTAVIVKKDKAFPIQTVEDLKGKRVGVIRGYTYPGWESEGYVRDLARNDEMLFTKLQGGRYDICFAGKLISQYYARELGLNIVTARPMYTLDISFRIHRQQEQAVERFNTALETLFNNGMIDRIIAQYTTREEFEHLLSLQE